MSHARWTLSPVVERETARFRRELQYQKWDLFGAVSLCLCGGGVAILALTAAANVSVFLFALAFGPAIWGLVAIVRIAERQRRTARLRADRLLAPLREEFGDGVGTLVWLRMLQGDAPTGEDVGMLWIEDGRLLFAGRRTSFALGPSGVRGPCQMQAALAGLRYPIRLALGERTGAGPLALSLEPIDVGTDRLTFEIDRWARTLGPPGQLPPTAVGPDAPSPARLLVGAVYATVYWASVWTAGLLHGELFILPFSAAILAPRMGASSPLVRWRAWRDRRRLG